MKKNKKVVKRTKVETEVQVQPKRSAGNFHIEFKNQAQKDAWKTIEKNEITFLIGPAGSAKSFISSAYACSSILTKRQKKIYLTRPIVEAGGEHLGYLPGSAEEKVGPYFTPIFDALDELVGPVGFQRELIAKTMQLRPLAYMRGTNLNDAICLLDEAQNITYDQMVLYLTRIGRNSKMIINGDPSQSDIRNCCLSGIVDKLEGMEGIGVVRFDASAIVRNPLIGQILDRLK
jgi:phosphate starvation-inducible PhoH-like protein